MPFTILYAVLTLLALILVFGVTYKIKGWKIAILTTVIALGLAFVFLIALISMITRNM
jgi:pyrroline-5-carboxylate reductase